MHKTVNVALFVPPARLTQAKNWLSSKYNLKVREIGFIREDDPDSQAVRYWGIHFRCTPLLYTKLKELTDSLAGVHLRCSLRGRGDLRALVKQELADRGWRKKP